MKLTKKLSLVFALILIGAVTYSQNCNFYIPLQENKGAVYKNFDANGVLQGSQEMKILEVAKHSEHIEATISSKQFDSNERLIHQGDFSVKCADNKIVIDITSILDPSMMDGFEDMEIRMETDDIVIPTDLSVGQKLPDARVNMKVSTAGMIITDLTFTLKERKVLSKEEVNVPAGSFEAYKIVYNFIIETKAMGMDSKLEFKNIEYHSADIGMVKSETYDQTDEIISYTVLNKIL